MLINILVFIVGTALLLVGADTLVRGSASAARRLRVSELAIGLTIVAFGTSAPELAVNVMASIAGRDQIAFGNIIGSNIFVILLAMGVMGLIRPFVIQRNTVLKEIPLSLLAAVVLLVMANDVLLDKSVGNILSRGDGLILLGFFTIFLSYVITMARTESNGEEIRTYPLWLMLIFIVGGLAGLFFGGRMLVESSSAIARHLGISERTIAITIVAAGTSLPELAVSALAVLRKSADMAVGNIIGSCIFNIFLILGLSATIHPAPYDTVFNLDVLVLIAGTCALMLAMFTGTRGKVDRWEAGILTAGYAGYLVHLICTA